MPFTPRTRIGHISKYLDSYGIRCYLEVLFFETSSNIKRWRHGEQHAKKRSHLRQVKLVRTVQWLKQMCPFIKFVNCPWRTVPINGLRTLVWMCNWSYKITDMCTGMITVHKRTLANTGGALMGLHGWSWISVAPILTQLSWDYPVAFKPLPSSLEISAISCRHVERSPDTS